MHQGLAGFSSHDVSSKEEDPDSEDWAWKGLFRGLLWRLKLGVLPSLSPCVEELRQAAADGRRKYAELRRRVLVDPHAVDVIQNPHALNMDNPLSQDPGSVWSRHFQISELEETIDKDLTRLYPEHGDFFQSTCCQVMLRRILLVWSLLHPSCSYRQGMHELLAPLLYVLHCDVSLLSEVKEKYIDFFDDRFDEPFCLESRLHEPRLYENGGKHMNKGLVYYKAVTSSKDSRSPVDMDSLERIAGGLTCTSIQVDEWKYGLNILVMGNDTYGTEGELGVLFSGRFVEHDAFFMFNALMCGRSGGINMADFFLPPNLAGVSPALEASAFLYKALTIVDLPLQSHLKGLGVEPQFFALRWIRVLFGREFDLPTLLILWDALLSMADFNDTNMPDKDLNGCLTSPRRVFMVVIALTMLLYLRLTLLAAPDASSVLQKLMKFPQTANINFLIEGARTLCPLVKEIAGSFATCMQNMNTDTDGMVRKASCNFVSHVHTAKFSPEVLQKSVPDFYWEEKWKNFVLRKNTQVHCGNMEGDSESNQGNGATPLFTGKVEDVQENLILVADNRTQGGSKTLRLETTGESIAVGATPPVVSNLPKTLDLSNRYDSTDSTMAITYGNQYSSGCNEEKDDLLKSLSTDKGPKSLLSLNHSAQADAMSRRPLLSLLPPRKLWIWSFGRSRVQGKGVDKRGLSHLEASKEPFEAAANVSADKPYMLVKEELLSKTKESNSIDYHTNRQGSNCSSTVSERRDREVANRFSEGAAVDIIPSIANFEKEARHLTNFRKLGHCMSDELQVIELAVARIFTSDITMGSSQNSTKVHRSQREKGHGEANTPSEHVPNAVHRAIEELKNISNKLLQM